MRADEMILVSVDDHIAEPAGMFDSHVPKRYRDRLPRWSPTRMGSQQWWYGDVKDRNLGLNAVAGKPPEITTSTRPDTTRCAPAATTCTSGCAT